MTDVPYFTAAPRTPGELVISRLIMVATAAIAVVVVAVYAIVSPVTAQWIGTMIGVNALNVAGGVIALFMRPGRRWALIVVSAFRCLTILTYYILPGGFVHDVPATAHRRDRRREPPGCPRVLRRGMTKERGWAVRY